MKKQRIVLPDVEAFYARTLADIPEYKPIKMAHAIVTEGGKTLGMSGFPTIGPNGIIGKGDMRVQILQALEYVMRTVAAAGATWDDIVHLKFFFVDREKWHREGIPARLAFFQKYARKGNYHASPRSEWRH